MGKNIIPTSNAFISITDADYATLPFILTATQAAGRVTRQKIYIVDFCKRKFVYVSDDLMHLCGLTREDVQSMGFDFYEKHISAADRGKLHDIITKASSFCDHLIKNGKKQFTIFCDFNLCNEGKTQLINHQVTPIAIRDGRPWLVLCSISLSPNKGTGNLVVKESGSNVLYKHTNNPDRWIAVKTRELRKIEHDILRMSAQGMTMNDIASALCKSPDTIKSCKQNIFDKTNATSISEAITFCQTYGCLFIEDVAEIHNEIPL